MSDLPEEIKKLRDDERALVVVDNQGFIVMMTQAAEELFQVGLEDIGGEAIELLVPEKMRFGHQAYRRGFMVEEKAREMDPGLEPAAERPDGSHIDISVWLEPVRADGKLFVVADVSPRSPGTPGSGAAPGS